MEAIRSNTCILCDNPIPENANTRKKYCSEACIRLARTRHPSSVARNAGGSTARNIASYAIQEQGCVCIICGWSIPDDLSYGLEVHHIIPVVDGGTYVRENLAVLCPNHHKLADLNRISALKLRAARTQAANRNKGWDPIWAKLKPAIERLEAQRMKLRQEMESTTKKRRQRRSDASAD